MPDSTRWRIAIGCVSPSEPSRQMKPFCSAKVRRARGSLTAGSSSETNAVSTSASESGRRKSTVPRCAPGIASTTRLTMVCKSACKFAGALNSKGNSNNRACRDITSGLAVLARSKPRTFASIDSLTSSAGARLNRVSPEISLSPSTHSTRNEVSPI